MQLFIALWRDDTATMHFLPNRDAVMLADDLDAYGFHEHAEIFQVSVTPFSPSEFKLKRVVISDDWKIVPAKKARKKTE